MSRRIRVPFLVDLVLVSAPGDIREAGADRRLDRPLMRRGPLINRWLAGRFSRSLRVPAGPLPSARGRDDPERIAINRALFTRLSAAPDPVIAALSADIAEAARFVAGKRDGDIGPVAQALFAKPFKPAFRANARTIGAARTIAGALSSFNPLTLLANGLTGRVGRAQKELAAALDNDPSAVHSAAIAVHNLVDSLIAMRALYAQGGAASIPAEAAASRALFGPPRVIRQAERLTEARIGTLNENALILLSTRDANAKGADDRIAFLSETWSACPAGSFVVALLEAIWRKAVASAPNAAANPAPTRPEPAEATAPPATAQALEA